MKPGLVPGFVFSCWRQWCSASCRPCSSDLVASSTWGGLA